MTRRLPRVALHVLIIIGLVSSLAVASARPAAAASPFTDIGSSIFKSDIEWLYAQGVTGGCTPTKYCPDARITREQMASFLVRMFALPPTTRDFFTDDERSAHEGDINRLAAARVTGGCTATTFCPSAVVTRAQMASFIARAAGLTVGVGRNYFNDDNGNLHEPNIDRIAAAGIAGGCAQWRFCPGDSVTRGQMAAFLRRVSKPVSPPPYPAPNQVLSLPQLLALLPTAVENRAGYDRAHFTHWVDADGDGCSTRNEVLISEALTPPAIGPSCALSGGSWLSRYDGVTINDPSGLDTDHLVALPEAWESGARSWTPARRQAFANDLDVSWSLIAVSVASNQSKSDRDPPKWMPPLASYHCTYLADWLAVKVRWSLSVDATERSTIASMIRACPTTTRPVIRAP